MSETPGNDDGGVGSLEDIWMISKVQEVKTMCTDPSLPPLPIYQHVAVHILS